MEKYRYKWDWSDWVALAAKVLGVVGFLVTLGVAILLLVAVVMGIIALVGTAL